MRTGKGRKPKNDGGRRVVAFLVTLIIVSVLGGGSASAATSVSGTVSDADGQAITTQDICVVVLGQGFGLPGSYTPIGFGATTNVNGAWTVTGLAPGTYKFQASDCAGSARNDWPTYYDPAHTGTGQEVTIAANATLTGVDIAIARATSITGHVYDGPGTAKPVGGYCLEAVNSDGFGQATAQSAADGSYTLRHLDPSRSYRVLATTCSTGLFTTEFEFQAQWYGGNDTPTALAPTVAQPATGIDLHLAPILSIAGGTANGPTSAALRFSAAGWGAATFLCGVDGAPLAACDADYTATGLTEGPHTIDVQAWIGTVHTPVRTFSWDFVPAQEPKQGESPLVGGPSTPSVVGAQASTSPAHTPTPARSVACKVPKLKRLSLARARSALARAHCAVGTVSRSKKRIRGKTLKVTSQSLRPGSARGAGTKVSIKLAYA